ncbi:MAG: DUF4855 domain-containing protein, partial [Clostridia bacterium]|nr:DUF4855 domain-containing protein [Clostridia bacterium]
MFSSFRRVLSAGLLAAVMTYLLASGSVKEVSRADSLLLSQGKSYEVSYESPIERAFPKKKYRSEKKLTDGVLGSQKSYSDSALVQFYRGTTLYLTFDLEEICAVDRVEIRALQQKAAGITIPRNGSVSVSEDGVAFGTVGSFDESAKARSNQVDYVTVSVELDRSYRARFVRVSLSCDVFLYMDEVCIFGSADADAGVKAEADPETAPAGYAQPLDGIGSICLMYTVGNYSRAQLLPYFAYVDGEGQPKDTLYDGMLFLPSGASGFDFSSPG